MKHLGVQLGGLTIIKLIFLQGIVVTPVLLLFFVSYTVIPKCILILCALGFKWFLGLIKLFLNPVCLF